MSAPAHWGGPTGGRTTLPECGDLGVRCGVMSTGENAYGWTTDQVAAGYFIAQAAVGVSFWFAMAWSTTFRSWIELVPGHRPVTDAFLSADLFVGVLGSLAAAWAITHDRPWAGAAAAFTLGGILYPTFYLISFVAATGRGGAPLAIMIPPSLLTSVATYLAITRRGSNHRATATKQPASRHD